MNILSVYEKEIPFFLIPYLHTAAMQRLKGIDMNCGMNHTSFPLFNGIEPYSRYEHSLGTAMIIWHFTHDPVQSLAGLFHDISTPAFSHVADFMKGDYLKQEANEDETAWFIQNDAGIMEQLRKDEIDPEAVSDYHRYPIADNDSPRLSADRLEYTCGDVLDYRLATIEEVRKIYADLMVSTNEEGADELCFVHVETAVRFADLGLQCGKIYASREDRYAMERLSDLLKECVEDGTLKAKDLYASEEEVIAKISSSRRKEEWHRFTLLAHVAPVPEGTLPSRSVAVKKRFIDPLVLNRGRVSTLNLNLKEQMQAFQSEDMSEWLKGDTF